MINPNPQLKTLNFQLQKFQLQDAEGNSISLADPNNIKNIPWNESEIGSVDLGDLPCRLTGPNLALLLQRLWQSCVDDAEIKFRIPHPRHDVFLIDLGYVQALLPATFAQLDPRTSSTGLANQLKVRFEVQEVSFTLDPFWQKSVNDGIHTYEDIEVISKQAMNVIQWVDMKIQVKKSLWISTEATKLDPEMRKQMQDQLQAHIARGDMKAAAIVQQFLDNSLASETGK